MWCVSLLFLFCVIQGISTSFTLSQVWTSTIVDRSKSQPATIYFHTKRECQFCVCIVRSCKFFFSSFFVFVFVLFRRWLTRGRSCSNHDIWCVCALCGALRLLAINWNSFSSDNVHNCTTRRLCARGDRNAHDGTIRFHMISMKMLSPHSDVPESESRDIMKRHMSRT